MKLFYIPFRSTVSKNTDNGDFYFSDQYGTGLHLINKQLKTVFFAKDKFYGFYNYKGKNISIYLKEGSDYGDSELFENERISFFDGDQEIVLDNLTQAVLFYSSVKNSVDKYTCYAPCEENVIISYSFVNDTYQTFDEDRFKPSYYLGEYYYFPISNKVAAIVKMTDQFKVEWLINKTDEEHKIEGPPTLDNSNPKPVLSFEDTVIVNLTAKRVYRRSLTEKSIQKSTGRVRFVQESFFIDGGLYCLNKSDGSEVWQQTFPVKIDDIAKLDANKVAVASERYLYIVNASNGEIEQQIDTELREGERQEHTSMTLLTHGDYLFLFSYKDCGIKIWHRNTLELLRTIDVKKEGWHFAIKRPKVIDDHIFVPTQFNSIGDGAMFVIDAKDIHAEVQAEERVSFECVMPSKEQPGIIEFKTDHADWAKMLRFLEREGLDAVLISSGTKLNRYFKPRKVHLTYSGYAEDKAIVKEKLDIFKPRFEHYIQSPLIPGIGIGAVEFSYTLI